MEQEEGLLVSTKIKSESKYKFESKTNTSSTLSSYPILLPISPLLLFSLLLLPAIICYKMKVWTDFDRVKVRTGINSGRKYLVI